MEIEQKIQFLNSLGTKDLITKIHEAEEVLRLAMENEAAYRHENASYIASYNEDCATVKNILAELEPPVTDVKTTVAQRETWLRKQRSTNANLVAASNLQNEVTFQIESKRIAIEIAKKKLESLKAVLGLRAAQIEFLKE
jgi:3-dehydroquinate dehydratase